MFSIYTSILFRQYKKRIADISGTDSQDIIEKIMDMTNKYERRIDTINNVIHIIQILCWFLCPLSSLFSNDLYALIALLGFLMFLADLAIYCFLTAKRKETVDFYRSYTDQHGNKE